MPRAAQVYSAVAIILSAREKFLDDQNRLIRPYGRVLYELLAAGILDVRKGENPGAKKASLQMGSYKLCLHTSQAGGRPLVQLTPSPLIILLVEEHGNNEAVGRFLEQAEAGCKRELRWLKQIQSEPKFIRAYAMQQVKEAKQRFGLPGVEALLEAA